MQSRISSIKGNTIMVDGLTNAKIGDLLRIGPQRLFGEVFRVSGSKAIIMAYEETTGLRIDDEVINTETPLSIELGPGLLGATLDGIGRRLDLFESDVIAQGTDIITLDKQRKWTFHPQKKIGVEVSAGDVLGYVDETSLIKTKILVPNGVGGKLLDIKDGDYSVEEYVATVQGPDGKKTGIKMYQVWPVKRVRPTAGRVQLTEPLITGQRVFDAFFQINKGGTAVLPGPFGSGKTVSEHQFTKFSNTDIAIFCGAGERGNEMADVLNTFPTIKDPKSGKPIMEKTVLLANTSNMPLIARESSVFTAATIAEFYRDMGYSVLLTVDSTSRWAEAIRQLGSELGDMPVEEGFPSSLFTSLASFYSRAGSFKNIGSENSKGSITIIGSISPPSGDFSEPVTQASIRLVDAYWELDTELANMRHYPAVNWTNSYSLSTSTITDFMRKNVSDDFFIHANKLLSVLHESDRINEIASIIGREALPDEQAATLQVADFIKLYFLQQSAFDPFDSYTPIDRTYKMLRILSKLAYNIEFLARKGIKYQIIKKDEVWEKVASIRKDVNLDAIEKSIDSLNSRYGNL